MSFQGPDPELWDRYSRATNAPVIMALGLDGVSEFNARVVAARTWEALSDGDRELILRAEYEISAGLSPTLQQPADWTVGSDWAAEDEAFGLEPGEAPAGDGGSQGKSLPDPDDGGWIGL